MDWRTPPSSDRAPAFGISRNPPAHDGRNVGISDDNPVSGDFDGDGKTDMTVWRESNGAWFPQLSSGGVKVVDWGSAATNRATGSAGS